MPQQHPDEHVTRAPRPGAGGWRVQTDAQPADVPAATWDALLAQQAEPTPFMRHAYLAALHASGSAVAKTGWAPRFACLLDRD